MPKGALLHAHLDATVNPETLLKLALEHPAIHMQVPEIVTAENIWTLCPTFKALSAAEYADGPGVTDQAYAPNTFVTIHKARNTFDTSLGGPEGFDNWVCSAMTINPAEAYGTHNTITKVIPRCYSSSVCELTTPIEDLEKVHKYLRRIEGMLLSFAPFSVSNFFT